MPEAGTSESSVAHFPPGTGAPTAAEREAERVARLKDPAHVAKLLASKANWYNKPIEERRVIAAERKAEKARKLAAKEAKEAAKEAKKLARHPLPPPSVTVDSVPPTVRSRRASVLDSDPPGSDPLSEPARPGAAVVKGLLDLCASMSPRLGDGTSFIQVNRIKPLMAFGVPCAGIQKPLWQPVDDAEFVSYYGGGEYSLRGYSQKEAGRPARAVTEPVPYRVAGHPNLDSLLTEEDQMRPNPAPAPAHNGVGPFRRPTALTPQAATAEADMHARELEHRETMDQRDRERTDETRRRNEARDRDRERGQTDVVRILAESKEKEADRLRETYESMAQNKSGSLSEVATLIAALKPGADPGLSRQHTDEVKQLVEGHKSEMLRITDQHREELLRLHTSHEAALRRVEDIGRGDRDRADKLVRETEQRSNDLVRAAEERAAQRVTDARDAALLAYNDLKSRGEERVRDQDAQWQRRFDDLKEAGARELRTKDTEISMMRSNMEGTAQVLLNSKDTEIKRLQHDLRDAREEAEKNKDWVGQMGKFEKTAEAMGFSKGGDEPPPDEDLKTTAVKAALGAVQNLPALITAGADAFTKIKNPGAPTDPAHGQSRAAQRGGAPIPRALGHAPPVQYQQLSFATEDGGYTPPPDARMAPPPLPGHRPQIPQQQPAIAPLEQSSTHAIVPAPVAPLETQQQPIQQQQLPLPLEQPVAPQAAQPQAPPPSVAPAALAAPPADTEQLDPQTVSLIQGFFPALTQAFTSRTPPEVVAAGIIKDNGIEGVRFAMAAADIETVLQVVNADQAPEHAVLKMRNGQKFLRALWAEVERQLAAPVPA